MTFRHEYKHEISYSDILVIRSRLNFIMKRDQHSINGKYAVHSIYFDDFDDTALREKLDGINHREKFRIRYYNDDLSYIVLEKKVKCNSLCCKQQCRINLDEAGYLIRGDILNFNNTESELLRELVSKMTTKGLAPKKAVHYTREAFVYEPGNVRITLDYGLRTSVSTDEFFKTDVVSIPIDRVYGVLEIKYDEFLASIVRDALGCCTGRTSSFSKYAVCRIYD